MGAIHRLENKVALITAGESHRAGNGAALCGGGARVHIIGLDEGKLEAVAAELGAAVATTRADMTDAGLRHELAGQPCVMQVTIHRKAAPARSTARNKV